MTDCMHKSSSSSLRWNFSDSKFFPFFSIQTPSAKTTLKVYPKNSILFTQMDILRRLHYVIFLICYPGASFCEHNIECHLNSWINIAYEIITLREEDGGSAFDRIASQKRLVGFHCNAHNSTGFKLHLHFEGKNVS